MLLTLEYMVAMYRTSDNKNEKRTIRYIINEFHNYAMPETLEGEVKFYDLLSKVGITE